MEGLASVLERLQPWQYSAVAVAMTLGITSVLSLYFHGRVTVGYVVSGTVAAALVSYAMMKVVVAYQEAIRRGNARLLEEMQRREEMGQQLMRNERLTTVGTMAAGVAHEINNPLAYMTLNLEMLRELVGSSEALDELFDDIAFGLERVRSIVQELRAFARPQDSAKPLRIGEMIEACAKLGRVELKQRGELVVDSELDPELVADGRLSQVLLNLILNASQALPSRGGPHEIRVHARAAEGRVRVAVSDTGPGVPPEIRERIFDPFFTTKGATGTGLGLSVSARIVAEVGGTMKVCEAPGGGACFELEFPATTRLEASTAPPEVQPVVGRVLVIDDEACLAAAIGRQLGAAVISTETEPRKGLERILTEDFDLILCDVCMPELSGAEIYEAVRARAPERLERLVFMTGGATSPETRAFIEGPIPVLQKPFDRATLLGLLRERSPS